jgi:hypothetical protein
MSTGIETWNMNLLEIGPMYPFPGSEMLWALLGLASWVVWHLVQMKMENAKLAEEEQTFSSPKKLAQAMELSKAETLVERLDAHKDTSFD